MPQQQDDMSEAELARFHEDHADDESLWKKPPRTIRSRRGQGPSVTFSVRLTGEELTRISRAAFAEGKTPSDFIRAAALNAVEESDEGKVRRQKVVDNVRSKIDELQAAVGQL